MWQRVGRVSAYDTRLASIFVFFALKKRSLNHDHDLLVAALAQGFRQVVDVIDWWYLSNKLIRVILKLHTCQTAMSRQTQALIQHDDELLDIYRVEEFPH